MTKHKFVPLTHILVKTANIKYVTLIDSGANCSAVTEGLVKALKLTNKIHYKECQAKAWDGKQSPFLGTIQMDIEIGGFKFNQKFFVAKRLGTNTQCLLGTDWLRESNAGLKYSKKGVKMTIGEEKQQLTLVKTSTKCIANNMVVIYDTVEKTKVEAKEDKVVKIAEVRTLDPYVSLAVKCTLEGDNLTGCAVVEQLDIEKDIYVESQLITIRKNTPKRKAKCLQRCNNTHASNCPTQAYYYAYIMIFNASDKSVLITEETTIGKFELVKEAEEDIEISEKTEKSKKKKHENVKFRVNLKQKQKPIRSTENITKGIEKAKEKGIKTIKKNTTQSKEIKRLKQKPKDKK